MRGRRPGAAFGVLGGTALVAVAAVVAAGVPAVAAVAAAPDVPTQAVALVDSVTPVLTAEVSSAAGGQVTAKFFAGTYAAGGAFDLVNGTQVTVASGSVARLTIPNPMRIGTEFDWQVEACQSGVCSAPTALQDTHVSPMLAAGQRPGATRLSFSTGDHVSAQVDVGTGNLLVSTSDLSLPGISGPLALGAAYNSASVGSGYAATTDPAGYGWLLTPYGIGLTVHQDGSVTYRGRAGLTGLFIAGASGFTTPGGFKADLVHNSDGTYTLTDHTSQTKQTFDSSGKLTKITDRDGNATTLAYATGSLPGTITSTAGTSSQRQGVYGNASGHVTTLTQTGSDGSTRTVTYTVNSSGDLASVQDALHRTTSFGYSGHQLTSITNPGGGVTAFTYGANGVTSIDQHDTAAGSPGDSVTRLSYPSDSQVLVAAPDTDQAQEVSAVPHTTYDLTSDDTGRVAKATDPDGNVRSSTYTANFDTASSTVGSGAGASTTTNTFGANSGESMTKSTSPTGATAQAGYGNTAAATKYLPSSTTDGQSNQSAYHYDGAGNLASATDANASEADVTHNSNGTVATSTDPGNGSNDTTYAYDPTTHQATGVTPVTGSSLGGQSFTYDTYGRLKTVKDGRNITATYGYDDNDRLSTVTYSDGTPSVTYTYDAFGRIHTRADGTGTTTYTYDDLGHLATRAATSGGGTLTYGYDLSGNMTTVTDAHGTTTYTYDAANLLTQMVTAAPVSTKVGFAYDDHARRTDTWYGTNSGHTIYKAHVHQDYDASGRVSRVWADQGPATGPTRQFDVTYCRAANGTPGTTCSSATADDRDLLQWSKDNLTGKTTTYGYDTANRLTHVATSGGGTTYSYGYDARGNRTTATSGPTLGYNAANQITTSGYTYDAAGDLTVTPSLSGITYDGAGRMTAATTANGTGTYTYAGTDSGELTHQTTDTGDSVDYVYGAPDQFGRPEIRQVKLAAGTAYIDQDPTTGQPLVLTTTTGTEAYYVMDGQGSPVEFINESTVTSTVYQYDPYGAYQTTTATGSAATQNPYRFVGGTYDRTTGWIKYGRRWYDPTTGRFTTQDTLSFLANPDAGNRYAYAGDDPVNNIDPTGNFSFADAVGVIAGTAAGALAGAAIAVSCPLTAGVTCVAAAAITAGLWGAGGGAAGAVLAGGDDTEVDNGALGGLVGGLTGAALGWL